MILLDAQALLAFLREEPAAAEVAVMLADETEHCVMSAINVAEVVDRLVRRFGFTAADATAGLRLLRSGGLDVLVVDEVIAEDAGRLRARHYDRATRALSMADCVALATARRENAQLATAEAPLAAAARAESVAVIALPDALRRRP